MSEQHRIVMEYKRSTPRTHVYESLEDLCTTSVYVKKTAPILHGQSPRLLSFTVAMLTPEEEAQYNASVNSKTA